MATIPERIVSFNAGRLPDMLTVKYELMTENRFRFFRGTCHLFYEDLFHADSLPASPPVWISGDLHLENYGTYKGDNRLVYFDMNDFDEAVLAPANHELSRMLCSILVAFDSLGIDPKQASNMAALFLKSYCDTLVRGKAIYIDPLTSRGIVRDFLVAVSKRKQQAILEKRTIRTKKSLSLLLEHPRHFAVQKSLKRQLTSHMNEWIVSGEKSPNNYKVEDVAFRLAGTGSVGLKRYMFLLRSTNRTGKYMLLEMKQATESSLSPYLTIAQPAWPSDSERIVAIQDRMQNMPPALLGSTQFLGDDFLIQEMQPTKDAFNFKLIRDRYRDIYQVIHDMGSLTASAQLRSSGWNGSAIVDELERFGRATDWQEQLLRYALTYADTVANDYGEYNNAYKAGYFQAKRKGKTSASRRKK